MLIHDAFDDISPFSDGLAAVCKGDKWGYMDRNGIIQIPYQFDQAYSFEHGVAIVELEIPMKEKMEFFIINEHGEIISPFWEDKRFLNIW